MIIHKLKIINYKLFQNITIEMNDDINIFVGENDSGKTTILEALSMVLTGKTILDTISCITRCGENPKGHNRIGLQKRSCQRK